MSKERKSSSRKQPGKSAILSSRTKKQIDSLPKHAQHIFTKAHASAIEQYKNPVKRQGARVRVLKRSPTRQHGRLARTNI